MDENEFYDALMRDNVIQDSISEVQEIGIHIQFGHRYARFPAMTMLQKEFLLRDFEFHRQFRMFRQNKTTECQGKK